MKKQRQNALIEYIKNNVVDKQEDIQKTLESMGFAVTQATVSRDIKDLRIVKAVDKNGIYRYIYNDPKVNVGMERKYIDIFINSVVNIESAMNDVVIKCHSGTASGACAAIDELYSDYVVGTLAGDDTVLAITRSEHQANMLVEKLNDLLK